MRTLVGLFFLCCLLAWNTQSLFAGGPTGPRYTWESFSHFWNKGALDKIMITKVQTTDKGYLVDYGYTTTMNATVDHGVLKSVCMRFVGGGENDAGGRTFRNLLDRALYVGTFRWPEANLEEVKKLFSILGQTAKSYQYKTSLFTYSYAPRTGWEFCTTFVPEKKY